MNRFCILFALFLAEFSGKASPAKPESPAALPVPKIVSIRLEPASIALLNGRDERRVLVIGETATGQKIDLTAEAKMISEAPIVEIDGRNFIRPKSKGETRISVSAAGLVMPLPVKVEDAVLPPVGFVRDVEPLLAKIGCNAGTCHGSAKGKNGFKLSLRGYDPDFDFQALINDLSGRRFNRVKADESLMLLKPTAEVPHEGRQVLKLDSREYNLLKQWIVEGTKAESLTRRANKIEVLPAEIELDLPGRSQHMLVLAHYADGTTRDVTGEAIMSSNNGEVLVIANNVATGIRRGEAAVLVRYEGNYTTRLVTVMGDRAGFKWAEVPEYNFIDKHVNTKLRKVKALPSDVCNDAEFIRRVYLDLSGLPPRPDKVRGFLADKGESKSKRANLINELLDSPDFPKYWANKWADLLQCNSEILGEKGVWAFRNWIEDAIAQNMPYDKFARALLLARGSSYKNPEVNYLRALRDTKKMTEDISQTFLGVRFNCNQCHDHPFEKWTQNQYYQFGAYFARVGTKNGEMPGEQIIFTRYDGGEVKHPKTDMDVAPKVPVGTAKEPAKDADRREEFVDWMTSKENPFFAKSMANRTWSYFFGRGIIDPVDDIRGSNPASNPELLDALTEDFVNAKLDVKHLMRSICNSRTYQLSVVENKWNEDDKINFSHANPRRLSAEQLLDAVTVATGSQSKFAGMPKEMRAAEIPDGMVKENDFLTLFGRPKRQSACECERTGNVTLSHALNLINGNMIGEAVADKSNRLTKFVEAELDNKKVVEEIYLSVLSRPPSEKEITQIDLGEGEKRVEVAQDLAWALLNSPSFLFNR
ncbi:MAG: DUF1549 and DUF1553 domain-containing protein [Verrucomicrobiota bacterium]